MNKPCIFCNDQMVLRINNLDEEGNPLPGYPPVLYCPMHADLITPLAFWHRNPNLAFALGVGDFRVDGKPDVVLQSKT